MANLGKPTTRYNCCFPLFTTLASDKVLAIFLQSFFLLPFSPEAAIIMSLVYILPVKFWAAYISLSDLEGIVVVQLLTCI